VKPNFGDLPKDFGPTAVGVSLPIFLLIFAFFGMDSSSWSSILKTA